MKISETSRLNSFPLKKVRFLRQFRMRNLELPVNVNPEDLVPATPYRQNFEDKRLQNLYRLYS